MRNKTKFILQSVLLIAFISGMMFVIVMASVGMSKL